MIWLIIQEKNLTVAGFPRVALTKHHRQKNGHVFLVILWMKNLKEAVSIHSFPQVSPFLRESLELLSSGSPTLTSTFVIS